MAPLCEVVFLHWVPCYSQLFKDQSRNGAMEPPSFGFNDLKTLVTVACDAKEWIAAHVLKR